MGKKFHIVLVVLIVIAVVFGFWLWHQNKSLTIFSKVHGPGSISDGVITFSYSQDFRLASNQEQILVSSYIPPCDQDFNYCLYYFKNAYENTNFESAGLRIKKRDNFTNELDCLNNLSNGYVNMESVLIDNGDYLISRFGPLGSAAAGHYTNGEIYRLWHQDICYEFEVKIGESQFANYPDGAIKLFTNQDRNWMKNQLMNMLAGATLNNTGKKLQLP